MVPFGDNVCKLAPNEPPCKKVCPLKKAKEVGEIFASQFGMREIMLRFASFGITTVECLKIYNALGSRSIEKTEENPFLLCSEDIGLTFYRADGIASYLGMNEDNSFRIQAGVLHVLRHNLGNGHTCIPCDKICAVAANLLSVSNDDVLIAMEHLKENQQLSVVADRLF